MASLALPGGILIPGMTDDVTEAPFSDSCRPASAPSADYILSS
jgi:hypothetical protein